MRLCTCYKTVQHHECNLQTIHLQLFGCRSTVHPCTPFFTSFFGHRPAQRECVRTGLRSHARCHPYPIPQPVKGWPHHRGLRLLLFSKSSVGSFTSHKNKSVKVLWDGTYGFSSLSEKTRKSNHLQMSLQRQHFLLSYLRTLSVGPARVWTRDLPPDRLALSQLS